MGIPKYRPNLAAEGSYSFKITDAELHKKTGQRKDGSEYTKYFIKFKFSALGEEGTYSVFDSFWENDKRYAALLNILGFEGKEDTTNAEDFVGKTFRGEIKHQQDKEDPEKTWPRVHPTDSGGAEADDDIPF